MLGLVLAAEAPKMKWLKLGVANNLESGKRNIQTTTTNRTIL